MNSENGVVLRITGVGKRFPGVGTPLVLEDVSFDLARGDFALLFGPSGSGKTTLLQLAAGFDQPTFGSVEVNGLRLDSLRRTAACEFRRRTIGFVFQAGNLLASLRAVENVEYVCAIRGDGFAASRAKALRALDAVGLAGRARAFPRELSGGEQQRVAVARCIAAEPMLVLADEPTAHLDSHNALELIALFRRLNRELGITFLTATHDARLSTGEEMRIDMVDGRVTISRAAS